MDFNPTEHHQRLSADQEAQQSLKRPDVRSRQGSASGSRGSRRGAVVEGKGGSNIIRVTQACTNCRRMKMRCVNADNPPCKRCTHFGEDCVVGQPTQRRLNARAKLKDIVNDLSGTRAGQSSSGFEEHSHQDRTVLADRVEQLENKVSSMHLTLQDILAVLQGNVAATSQATRESGLSFLPVVETVPNITQAYGSGSHCPIRSRSSTPVQVSMPSNEITRSIEKSVSQPSSQNLTFQQAIPQHVQEDKLTLGNSTWLVQPIGSSSTIPPGHISLLRGITNSPAVIPPMDDAQLNNHATVSSVRVSPQSLFDEEDGDPLAPGYIAAPLGAMAELAEVAIERANLEGPEHQNLRTGDIDEPFYLLGSNKKRKLTTVTNIDRLPGKFARSQRSASQLPSLSRATFASPGFQTNELDVVDAGLVPESDARELYHLFFQGCNIFIPIFDPQTDTWESLKRRSPLLFTTIIGIGARVKDGGGSVSETQRHALSHARQLASDTLFDLAPKAETVQAMILLATYNENGRIPASHASALAMAIGLDKSLVQLLQTGMGAGLSCEELESERDLVMGSRIILYLFQLEHQLAFGTGRPALFRQDLGINRCREILLHPLSVPLDARLVSSVEMISLRAPLHVLLTNSPDQPLDRETIFKLREANASFERWLMHWEAVFAKTYTQQQSDFCRESLVAQKEYASLFTNSQLLRGIRNASDVKRMPSDKREIALRAMTNAQNCIRIALRGKSYGRAFKFAVHYTHVCVAFAASFLIRIARLFPLELDLRQSAKDVEELATLLSQVPAGRYARSIRLILRRARKHNVMPLASGASTPLRTNSRPTRRHELLMPILPECETTPINSSFGPATWFSTGGTGFFDPSIDHSYQYDFDFAQELWERAGLPDGHGSLPLFLDGESLGDTLNASFALEDFFIPPELDLQFNYLGVFPNS